MERESPGVVMRPVWKSTIAALVAMNFPDNDRLLLFVEVRLILLSGCRLHNLVRVHISQNCLTNPVKGLTKNKGDGRNCSLILCLTKL